MDTTALIELLNTLKESGYGHIEITHEGTHVVLDKSSAQSVVTTTSNTAVAPMGTHEVQQGTPVVPVVAATKTPVDQGDCEVLKSPIVGTFYASGSPDAPAYIKVGSQVKKGDTMCIIEAMKLMNEIEAECDGEVVEILVANEAPVEYGQGLFKIKKSN